MDNVVPAIHARTGSSSVWHRLRHALPGGSEIPESEWRGRHKVILIVIAGHAVGLAGFGAMRGHGWPQSLMAGLLIAVLGALAAWPALGRRFRSSIAALALVTCSAVLVQFWDGVIEGHFHFFVVVAIVSLYMDWVPFLLSVLYVAVEHGLVGTLRPEWVYNHPDAIANPWLWAAIHAVLVLAECAALVVVWRSNERARDQAELVLRSTGEGLLGIGKDGRVTFANPAATAVTGIHAQRLVGASVRDVLPALDPALTGMQTAEADLSRPDGTVVPVEVVATPIQNNGYVEGSVWALKDISERRRSEKEHSRMMEQSSEIKRLHELDEFKTLFINTAAHELRTPLTPLKLHLHTLRSGKRGELNAEQQRIVTILTRNLDRLGQLIEEVLDVGRLQAGRLSVQKQPIVVSQVVREAMDSFQEFAGKVGVTMTARVDPDLRVEADLKRLNQVLFNLFENALKFTPTGGNVSVEADRSGPSVLIRVKDTGIGLRAEDIARLFTPFTQIHDPMEQTRTGSGLGLYICKGLVQLHGGTIECESPGLGKGTTFTVTLPAAAEGSSPLAAASPSASAARAA